MRRGEVKRIVEHAILRLLFKDALALRQLIQDSCSGVLILIIRQNRVQNVSELLIQIIN